MDDVVLKEGVKQNDTVKKIEPILAATFRHVAEHLEWKLSRALKTADQELRVGIRYMKPPVTIFGVNFGCVPGIFNTPPKPEDVASAPSFIKLRNVFRGKGIELSVDETNEKGLYLKAALVKLDLK